jgi:uncharacterized protein YgbK (DUF1537 family)
MSWWKITYWRSAFFALFVVLVAGGMFLLGSQVFTNSSAIEKGCVLLNNKINESAAQSADPNSQTAVLIGTIVRVMTEEEFRRLQKAPPMQLPPVNCKQVADDPESIRAEPTVTVTTPTRSPRGNP